MNYLFVNFLACLIGVFAIISPLISSDEVTPVLIQNMENIKELPRNFRTSQSKFLEQQSGPQLNLHGLNLLSISGSSQFSENSLVQILEALNHPSRLFIVDLRQECHGFINGNAVSWRVGHNWENKDKSLEKIIPLEKKRVQDVLGAKKITLHKIIDKDLNGSLSNTTSFPLTTKTAMTEEELSKKYLLNYIRLPVTDHCRPEDKVVDLFVDFVKQLPEKAHLHFHCSAGRGRTTTFMSMYDMMRHAKEVSFEDILTRQWLIGGTNLMNPAKEDSWKSPLAKEKLLFLKNFYQYCRDNTNQFEQSWQEYIKEKPKN